MMVGTTAERWRYPLLAFPLIDSTNDEVRRQAGLGGEDGLVISGDVQTGGRGRSGRQWQSPPGNLHMSILVRPACPAERAAEIAFVAALAAADAVAGCLPAGRAVRCKWPNDVLIDDRKTAGILIESEMRAEGGIDWIAVGIGINVVTAPDDGQVMFPATCLQRAGAATASAAVVRDAVVERFSVWRQRWENDGFAPIRRAWLAVAWRLGEPLAVRNGGATIAGVFRDLDRGGAMMLETAGGMRLISAGDVSGPAPAATE